MMRRKHALCLSVLTGLALTLMVFLDPSWAAPPQSQSPAPKTRTILFTYETTLGQFKPGKKIRLWLPIPATTPHQKVQVAFPKFPAGAKVRVTNEKRFGNKIYYIETKAGPDGTVRCQVTYRIQRDEVRGDAKTKQAGEALDNYLKATTKIPIGGKPSLVLLRNKRLPDNQFALGKSLYEIVNRHMKYHKPKGEPWGNGDAVWACDSKYGNCTDFHSLFISLARTKKIPAKFEIGFPLPAKRGNGEIKGYHCWAWFQPKNHGWLPVDISAASLDPKKSKYYFGNLTENRVAFTTGRDLILSPRQQGAPLNFFVYPYAEVDGKAVSATKINRRFLFQDVK